MTDLTEGYVPALDSVRLTLNARWTAQTWDPNLQGQVRVAAPDEFVQTGAEVWITLVATFASTDEHPVKAAQRLTKYLLAYQETHGRMPTLASVQKHAADRHLQEPR